jgi:hypothetical protein
VTDRLLIAPGDPPLRWRDASRGDRTLLVVVALAVIAPVVGAAVAAGIDGYVPFGDDAVLAVRAGDVVSADSPLVGMPSGTGAWSGVNSHHPGPLLFWLYAPGVELLGPAVGLLTSVAVIGSASVVGGMAVAFRRGGGPVALLAALSFALTYRAAGGASVLYSPLNPVAAVLPFVCFLWLTWGVVCRDRALLPWWVLTGSLVVQADLAYLPAVTVLAGVVAVALLAEGRRSWRRPAIVAVHALAGLIVLGLAANLDGLVVAGGAIGLLGLGAVISGAGRAGIVTLAVAAACWAFPLGEALTNGGGNLADLADAGTTSVAVYGAGHSLDAVRLMALPLLGVRDSTFDGGLDLDALVLVGLAGVLLAVAAGSSGPGWSAARRLLSVAAPAWAIGAVAAALVPVASGFNSTYYYWLLGVGSFTWVSLALVVVAVTGAARRVWSLVPAALVVVSASIVVVGWGPADDEFEAWIYEALPELAERTRAQSRDGGPYEVVASGGPHFRALENGLISQWDDGGVAVRTHRLVNYYGDGRSATGQDDAIGVLWVLPAGLDHPPEDAELIARYEPDAWDATEVDRLAADVAAEVALAGSLEVSTADEDDLGLGLYGHLPDVCPVERPVETECRTGAEVLAEDPDGSGLPARALLDLYRAGLVDGPTLSPELAGRLRSVYEAQAVEVWLGPVPELRR